MATVAEKFEQDLSDFINGKIQQKEVSRNGVVWYEIRQDQWVEVWTWKPGLIRELQSLALKYMVPGSFSDHLDEGKTIYRFRVRMD